jgi:uncharacterized protein YndB with AHSA1/START domain
MDLKPFEIEKIYNAPVEKVWKALTDKDEMKKWYFDLAEFRPEVGFEFSFTAGSDEKRYLHLCRVTEVQKNKKLTYSWRYDGFEGNSYVTWELYDENGKTKVKLIHSGLDTFPAETNPDLARKNFEQGWNEILGKSLKEFLES